MADGQTSYLQSQHLGIAQYDAAPTYVKLDLFCEPISAVQQKAGAV
jgi:hypothetical protein